MARPIDLPAWPWANQSIAWSGRNRSIPVAAVIGADGRHWNIYDVSSLFPDTVERKRPRDRIKGFVWHHDGVLFSGKDANFSGATIDESLSRCNADYQHALSMGWKVFPYHATIDLEGRIFIPRKDVLDTQRAHVAGYDPATGEVFNETRIGISFMGNFADGLDASGRTIPRQSDRPNDAQIAAAQAFMFFATNREERRMSLHPHKFFARYPGQDWKPCPGDQWVGDLAWSGDPANPIYIDPQGAAIPEPPKQEPPVGENADGIDLALVIDGKRVEGGVVTKGAFDATTNSDIYRRPAQGGWIVAGVPRKAAPEPPQPDPRAQWSGADADDAKAIEEAVERLRSRH